MCGFVSPTPKEEAGSGHTRFSLAEILFGRAAVELKII
jgi:hypothetical protein